METQVDEIAAGIYRLATFVPGVGGPAGMTFNQFLVEADEPLLFHCGQRSVFASVSAAVRRVLPLERLRWISYSHAEADECGSLNDWLAAAPQATAAQGGIGCNIWLNDAAMRPPRALRDGEVIDLGGKRVRHYRHLVHQRSLHPSRQWPAQHRWRHSRARARGRNRLRFHRTDAAHGTHHPQARRARAAHARGHARVIVLRCRKVGARIPCRLVCRAA
jgi:hypothetical protein